MRELQEGAWQARGLLEVGTVRRPMHRTTDLTTNTGSGKGSSSVSVNHMPWDNGAVDHAITTVLGEWASRVRDQKTIKTLCDRRVPLDKADYKQATTCPKCLAEIEHQEEMAKLIGSIKSEQGR